MFKKVIILFFAWRLFLFIPLFISENFLKFREGFGYVSGNVWANFDGIYYLYIAKAGYTVDNAGFFPLYPLLIKIFSVGESSIQFYAGLVLSSSFLFLGLVMLYKLVRIDFPEKIAVLVLFAVLVFPTSFFFAAIYSESLFLLLTVSSFYFARKGNWVLASILGILLTATRLVGIAILPALLFEFYLQNKTLLLKKSFPIFLTPLGLAVYTIFNHLSFGNALQFIKAQGTLLNNRSVDEIVLFPQTIYRYLNILLSLSPSIYEWWVALLELSAFIFAALMLYMAWKKKIRVSYIIFSVIALLIPASTGTFSGLPRYILILFPMFMAIALIQYKWIKLAYFTLGLVILVTLFALFSKGYFLA